jgi:hypothetical protein
MLLLPPLVLALQVWLSFSAANNPLHLAPVAWPEWAALVAVASRRMLWYSCTDPALLACSCHRTGEEL